VSEPLTLVLPEPPSLNVYWRKYRNRMVLSPEGEAYKLHAMKAGREKNVRQLVGPLSISVTWFRARKSGDLDNRLKCIFDALQGVAYENDSQIVEIHAYRDDTDRKNSRVEIEVQTAA
jgi:Holliday junction resolvase RusA-like endonuclease